MDPKPPNRIDLPPVPLLQRTEVTAEGDSYTPLLHDFLSGDEAESFILDGIRKARKNIWIAAPYYDIPTLQKIAGALAQNPQASGLEKTLIISDTRGCYRATEAEKQKGIIGVGDIAEQMGFTFKILPHLHAKVYLVDQLGEPDPSARTAMLDTIVRNTENSTPMQVRDYCKARDLAKRAVIGSSNTTQRGMHRNLEANIGLLDLGEGGREWVKNCEALALPATLPQVKHYLEEKEKLRRQHEETTAKQPAPPPEQIEKDFVNFAAGYWQSKNLPEPLIGAAKEAFANPASEPVPAPLHPGKSAEAPLKSLFGDISLLRADATHTKKAFLAAAYQGLSQSIFRALSATPPPSQLQASVKLPTNTGELDFLSAIAARNERNTLILTPTRQAARNLETLCKTLNPGMSVQVVNGEQSAQPRPANGKPEIVIANYQGIDALIARHIINPAAFSVVVNHALHADAVSEEALAKLIRQFTHARLVINHSATGEYLAGDKHNGIFIEPAFVPSLKDTVEKYGALASVKSVVVANKVVAAEASADATVITREMKARLSSDPKRTDMLVNFHEGYVDKKTGVAFRDQKAIAYCYDIDHADKVAEAFNKKFGPGYAAAFHSGLSESQQKDILARFKRGEIRVLTNIEMLPYALEDGSCTVCYNFVPSQSAHLIEKQSQTVMQLPRTQEEAEQIKQQQHSAFKQAYIVDFYNEGTRGQVLFSKIAEGASLRRHLEPKADKAATPDRQTPAASEYLPEGVQVLSSASDVMKLERRLEDETNLQENFISSRHFLDAVKTRCATQKTLADPALESDLVAATCADYFRAVGSAYKGNNVDSGDSNFIAIAFNGFHGQFPIDAGDDKRGRGFHMHRKNMDYAATALGRILEQRRGFIQEGSDYAALKNEITSLPQAAQGQAQALLDEARKDLAGQTPFTLGNQSFGAADMLTFKSQSETPHCIFSPGLSHALRTQFEALRTAHAQVITHWNNPGAELSPPLCLYDALPDYKPPAVPVHLQKKQTGIRALSMGSMVAISDDGFIGFPRGEGYANNWRIKLPVKEEDVKALSVKIMQRNQLINKELEPSVHEEFDKPRALAGLLKKLPAEEAHRLALAGFDRALDEITARQLLPGDRKTLETNAFAEMEKAPDFLEARRTMRQQMRARVYAKQYQANMVYAEAILVDFLIEKELLKQFPENKMHSTQRNAHVVIAKAFEGGELSKHTDLPAFSTPEDMYRYFRQRVLHDKKTEIMALRAQMLKESLGQNVSPRIAQKDYEDLEQKCLNTADLMSATLTEALVPPIANAIREISGPRLREIVKSYQTHLSQDYFNMPPEAMAETFKQNADMLRDALQDIIHSRTDAGGYTHSARPNITFAEEMFAKAAATAELNICLVPYSTLETQMPSLPSIAARVLYHTSMPSTLSSITSAPNVSQLTTIPMLENSTPEERSAFAAKYRQLPEKLKQLVKKQRVSFVMDSERKDSYLHKGSILVFSDAENISPAVIEGRCLAATLNVPVSKQLLTQAIDEHYAIMLSGVGKAAAKHAVPGLPDLMKKVALVSASGDDKRLVGEVLSGAIADRSCQEKRLTGSAREKILHMFESALQVTTDMPGKQYSSPILLSQDGAMMIANNKLLNPEGTIDSIMAAFTSDLRKSPAISEAILRFRDVFNSRLDTLLQGHPADMKSAFMESLGEEFRKIPIEQARQIKDGVIETFKLLESTRNDPKAFTDVMFELLMANGKEQDRAVFKMVAPDMDIVGDVEEAVSEIITKDKYGARRFPPYGDMELISAGKSQRKHK
jgi:hypothetical protein